MKYFILFLLFITATAESISNHIYYSPEKDEVRANIDGQNILLKDKLLTITDNSGEVIEKHNVLNYEFEGQGFPINFYKGEAHHSLMVYNSLYVNTFNNENLAFKVENRSKKHNSIQENHDHLIFSTFLGGSKYDELNSVATTNDGFIFSGNTNSEDLFLINEFYDGEYKGDMDIIIGKFNDDFKPEWITLIGGSLEDSNNDLVILSNGKFAICGYSKSSDYPITEDAFQKSSIGEFHYEGILTIFDKNGELYYSTFIGGEQRDIITGIAANDNIIWGAGRTLSENLPITENARERKAGGHDAILFKFDVDKKIFDYLSYFGGEESEHLGHTKINDSFEDVCICPDGNPVFAGSSNSSDLFEGDSIKGQFHHSFGRDDAIAVKFDRESYEIIWGTNFGGQKDDHGVNIICDSDNNAILAGYTSSDNLPVFNAFQRIHNFWGDNFIASFDKNGKRNWASYYGGERSEFWTNINYSNYSDLAITNKDQIIFTGYTQSKDLPKTDKNIYSGKHISFIDIYIGIISSKGSLISTSYFGDISNEIPNSVGYKNNQIYIVGKITKFDSDKRDIKYPLVDAYQDSFNGETDGIISVLTLKSPTVCENNYFYYPEFSDTTSLNILKDATLNKNSIYLTKNEKNQSGGIWYNKPVSVRDGFVTNLSFKLSDGYDDFEFEESAPGADGIAFVLQNHNPNFVGSDGGGIGYSGIPNSIAVELDLYRNDNPSAGHTDLNGNHVAIQSMGKEKNTTDHSGDANLGINNDIDEIKIDGTIYYMMVDYGIEENVMRVWLSDDSNLSGTEPVLISDEIDLHNLLDLYDNHKAYVGITSSTGNSYQNHELLSWEFCSNEPEENYTSVETQTESKQFVYPNPTDEIVTIETELQPDNKYYLMDIEGRIYDNERITGKADEIEVNLKGLSNGVYFLRIMNSDLQNSKDYKIIKK